MENNNWETTKKKKVEQLEKEFQFFLNKLEGVRSNRISLEVIRRLMIDYQGEKKPIKSVANLRISSNNELVIRPFEPKLIPLINKTILDNQLGYKVERSTKEEVCLTLSPITKEIREKLFQEVKVIIEEGKVAFRRVRQDFRDWVKKDKNTSQDQKKNYELQIDKLIKDYQDKLIVIEEKKMKELSH